MSATAGVEGRIIVRRGMTDIAARLARSWCPFHHRPPSLLTIRLIHLARQRALAIEVRGCCAHALLVTRTTLGDLVIGD